MNKRSEVLLAASRAATLLKILHTTGHVPSCHDSHVREVLDNYAAAHDAWIASINAESAEVANG